MISRPKARKVVITDSGKGFQLVADEMITAQLVNSLSPLNGVTGGLYKHILGIVSSSEDLCGLRLYAEKNNESAKRVYEAISLRKMVYERYEKEIC